jgi:predicted ester cyclase
MSASANEASIRRAVEAIWNRNELDVADELFAHDYRSHGGLVADLVLGPEAIKISVALYRVAFPDLCVEVEELHATDDTVVFRWTANTGPTGRTDCGAAGSTPKSLTGTTRSRFVGRKIVESWTEWDRTDMPPELGFGPSE